MANDKTIISEYLEQAKNYFAKADATLAEVNKCKQEVMQLKTDIMERINNGQYLWDSKRIVISAPEIIIGNVNKNGDLLGGGSVFIKGSGVNLQGVGDAGTINMKAPLISQVAVNPGIDGVGDVVEKTSAIVSVARGIMIDSQSPQEAEGRGGTFVPNGFPNGVTVSSDESIQLDTRKSKAKRKKAIEDFKKIVENAQKSAEDTVKSVKERLEWLDGDVKVYCQKDSDMTKENDLTKTNILALDELSAKLSMTVSDFCYLSQIMVNQTSVLAEAKRKIACLEKELAELNKVDDEKFKKDSTKTNITMMSENIRLYSLDGEGHVRTNPGAGIELRGNNIDLKALDEKGVLTPKEAVGRVRIISRNVDISTANVIDATYKDGKLEKAKYPLEGNVTIRSKTVDVTGVDYEQTEPGKFKETALNKESTVNIRAQKVKVKTIDTEGKSVGKFSVNSQNISLKSTDIKEYKKEIEMDDQGNFKHPAEMHSDKVADKSQMLLLTENINIGYKNEKMISKKLDLYSKDESKMLSEKKAVVGHTTDKDESTDAGFMVTDSMTKVYNSKKTRIMGKGGITVNGETTFESKVNGKTVEVENLNASKAVKAPNITDGISVDTSKPGEDPKESVVKNKSNL